MKHILAFAGGGLGNRLNIILSALTFYEATQYPLKIIWLSHQSFQARFEDLFESFLDSNISIETLFIPDNLLSITIPFDFSSYSNRLFIIDSYNEHTIQSMYNLSNKDNVFTTDTRFQIEVIPNLKDYNTFIFVSPKFLPVQTSIYLAFDRFFSLFKPIAIETILQFIRLYSPTTGVHIRLTDKCSINNYTKQDLDNDIYTLFPTFNSNKVFICSDDLSVEEKILQSYPNCIHYKKNNHYDFTNETINRPINTCREAVIDFFIFCSCKDKCGINSNTVKSTFFEVAELLHDSFVAHYHLNQ